MRYLANCPPCKRRGAMVRLWVAAAVMATATVACQKAPPPPVPEVMAIPAASVPLDPADPAWTKAPQHVAALIPQDLVEPRLMTPSTAEVRVRAVATSTDIAFRLEWADASRDDLPGAARFVDACAVQVPAVVEPDVPAPQMGEPGKPVEITYWNAGWQAGVNGRGQNITDLYPNASIDHYPFQAAALEEGSTAQREMAIRYEPARAVGNPVAGPHDSPVQDLVAQGPGTLSPAPSSSSKGQGQHTENGWAVVIVRRLPNGLSAQSRSQVAFAVWEGAQREAGAVKMRTGWIPLSIQGKP